MTTTIDTVNNFTDTISNKMSGATSEPMHIGHSLQLSDKAEAGTHFIATQVMDFVDATLSLIGLEGVESAEKALYATLVILLAFGVGAVVRWILVKIIRNIPYHYKGHFMLSLESESFFSKLSRIIPPILFLAFIQVMYEPTENLSLLLTKCGWIYVVFVSAIAATTLITAIYKNFDVTRNKKNMPLRGIAQLVKGTIWILATIVIVSIIVDRSPVTLIAGLSAFAAVLMLVFKDSILGVVAGVQLSDNDMLREGDWIKVDGANANGTVKEVSLVSVKVQNWDNTITTLPPYSLITGSFQNYRNMKTMDRRRIMRNYMIDADSVKFVDDEILEMVATLPGMKEYIDTKLAQKKAGKEENINNSQGLVNGTIETNLGLLRAYIGMYLQQHPHIDSEGSLCFVYTQEQTPNGIPLQVYCFTATSEWVEYECIQSEVFEHIAAVLPKFKLYTFENPSGRDSVNEGYLEAGGNPDNLYGLPHPFIKKDSSDNQSSQPVDD